MGLGVQGRCVVGRRIDPLVAVADMRAAGVEPVVPYPGSNVPWACQCLTCGALVTPRLDSVRGGQGGCRRCGQRRVRPFLSHEQAEAQLRAAGMEPLVPYPGTTRAPWAGRCLTCGRLGAPRLDSIRRGARACQRCAARAAAHNRTPADVAVAAMRAAGLEPVEPSPGRPHPVGVSVPDLRGAGHPPAVRNPRREPRLPGLRGPKRRIDPETARPPGSPDMSAVGPVCSAKWLRPRT